MTKKARLHPISNWLPILLFVIIAQSLYIQAEELCLVDCNSSSFALKAEYLYLRPSFNNDFIAAPNINAQIPFNLHPGGPGKKNKFDYTSGYRLSAFYYNPNAYRFLNNACLRFTYLPASHSRKISLDSFLSALISPITCEDKMDLSSNCGFLNSHHHLKYYAGDLSTSWNIFNDCGLDFSIQPGLHYTWMSYHTRTFISSHIDVNTTNNATLKEKSQTWGIGPQLGLTLNYQLFNWLTLKGGMQGGLLLSRASAHFDMELFHTIDISDDSLGIDDPKKSWKIFPFWETLVGISVSFCTYGYQLELEVGYEYLTYPNFINRIGFPGLRSSDKVDNAFTAFDFRGPYASITINF